MKWGKAVLIGVIVIMAVVGVAIWQILANLDTIVAGVIEDVGTEVLQTPVKVKTVNLDLKAGKVGISGMTIKNLAGYSDPNVFSMDDIAVDLDLSSIGKNPLVIEEILIRQPKVFAEVNKDGVSNLQALSKNIESSSSKQEKQEPVATDESGEELKMIIRKFRFEGGNLKASSQVNPDKKIDQALPAISMDDLGAKKGGANGQEIAIEMMKIIVARSTQVALKAGLNRAVEKEKQKLMDKASDKIKGLFAD
jgi:uncharacterized protein involved in outer membrane biogenesis